MSDDPRSLLQQVNPTHLTSDHFLLTHVTTGRQSRGKRRLRLWLVRQQDRQVRERSRPIPTRSKCFPVTKSWYAITTQHILLVSIHPRTTRLNFRSHPSPHTGKEAGLAFERAATIQTEKLSEPDDAANTLLEAFKVYRKTDPEDAARVLQKTIRHFTTKGNFRRAATNQMQLAELYELEIGDAKRALPAYEDPASWFESDNAEA